MKEITTDVLKDAAHRLLFTMSEDEYRTLLEEFGVLKRQMELIGKIPDLDSYEPMTFPFECTTAFLREDIPSLPLTAEEALANAGCIEDGQIKLPKVVG